MKRFFAFGLLAAALGASLTVHAQAGEAVTVYQDPNCGCCHGWAEHMRAEGYDVYVGGVLAYPEVSFTIAGPTRAVIDAEVA